MSPDLLAVGRISVDLFAREAYASFAEPQTFIKSIGGSPTNVAIAAARLGQAAAIVTKVGDDALGPYVTSKLASFGVDTTYVGVAPGLTPVVLASLDPPDAPAIHFLRSPAAPDTTLQESDVPERDIRDCGVLWLSACALAEGSTAGACLAWLGQRSRSGHTVLDLDYRPSFWGSTADARRAARAAIDGSTVVVGNTLECEMAVGHKEPEAAVDALLHRGVSLAIVKMGGDGVLLATPDERIRIDPLDVEVACGLGAGDAFGGALVHGLLSGWPLARIGRFANASGALVASRLLCSDAMPSLAELDAFIIESEKGKRS